MLGEGAPGSKRAGYSLGRTMETVLLVGGAGYVGSHAAKCLAGHGYRPVIYDNLSRGHAQPVSKWGPVEVGDIADRARLGEVMARHAPRAVMHFAAFAYVGESVTDPALYYVNNVAGTLSLLDAMRTAGVRHLVFSSTCATYGVPAGLPIGEETVQNPINPYGRSKLMVEQILADYAQAYDLRSACLRYFNAAGADPDGEIGEAHDPETHLIPIALDVAAGRRAAVSVYGNDYPTRDGTCVRDYVHVVDLAEAHVLAAQRLLAGEASLQLNLGNGEGHTVREVIEMAEEVTGRPIPIEWSARRPGDPAVLVASAQKARAVLGWQPRFPALRQIIETAWLTRAPRDAPR
jgi:UDP-arabinose 4-epimerase